MDIIRSNSQFVDGNDVYRTHGFDVQVDNKMMSGITYSFAGHSELYTKPVENAESSSIKNKNVPIKFTEDDFAALLINNKAQKKLIYWKTGFGWRVLNDKKIISGLATGQQKLFHELVNSEEQYHYQYISTQGKLRQGAMLYLGAGISHTLMNKGKCSLTGNADITTRLSTIQRTNIGMASQSMNLKKSYNKSEVSLEAGVSETFHSEGIEYKPLVELGYRRLKWGVKSSVELPSGKPENSTLYNTDKEPIARISIYKYFRTH